jgi:hypothetical protein
MIPEPPVTLGQTVFIAWAHAYAQTHVVCPICAGNKSVVLILGSGEHVDVACQGCEHGYEGPRGTVVQYTADSGVRSGAVTGLSYERDDWHIVVGHDHVTVSDDVLFLWAEAAEARRVVLHAAAEAQAQRNFESQFKTKRKDHGWTVRYHRERIADLRRQLAWHEGKLAAKHDPATDVEGAALRAGDGG